MGEVTLYYFLNCSYTAAARTVCRSTIWTRRALALGLGFDVWGLGIEVWGLRFGVWGLRFWFFFLDLGFGA